MDVMGVKNLNVAHKDLFFEGKEESKVFPEVFIIQTKSQLILLRILTSTAQRYMCVCPQCVFVYEYAVCAGQKCMAP